MKDFRTAARRKLRKRQDPRPPPLQKLLEGADCWGQVFVEHPQQWPTFSKALKNGYIELRPRSNVHTLTDKGREYLIKQKEK